MADTFDPYDENDVFNADSLNNRFESLKNRINEVPLESNQLQALGPNHISSILDATRTQTKVLTPQNAVTADGGAAFFCDPIIKNYPGYLSEDFELSKGICWQRIIDSTGGSGGAGLPSTRLELDLTSLTLGSNKLNALLIMSNIEFCSIHQMDAEWGTKACDRRAVLVTIITTISSTGTRTFHWDSLRYTCPPQRSSFQQHFSVDVSNRMLLNTDGLDVKEVQVLAAALHDFTAQTGTDLHKAYIRFCQLTAVALQAKVN
jgi:hypothetical protein